MDIFGHFCPDLSRLERPIKSLRNLEFDKSLPSDITKLSLSKKGLTMILRKLTKEQAKIKDKLRTKIRRKLDLDCSDSDVATFFLKVFVYQEMKFESNVTENLGFHKKGEFTKWRNYLQQKGFVTYDYKTRRHSAGLQIVKAINEFNSITKEFAFADDLHRVESRVFRNEERLNKLETLVEKIVDAIDPPANKGKVDKYLSNNDIVLKLIKK